MSPLPVDLSRYWAQLLAWLDAADEPEHLVQAALAHLWFETIHPVEDGNRRVGRVLIDLVLARDAGYTALAQAQHGAVEATDWVVWFVADQNLNARQRKVVNTLLDAGPGGFAGGMSTKKYESLAATSRATASRELIELEALGLLCVTGAGRSTRYGIKFEG